ncbi:sulfatase-like hydrolase/transferase [Parablastomonas sp. CN1-191]|uniref:sulfatase-like hydrolase/transferase n=1 Tax=Parablastomonas sp. CN1-191 TaxID=3400908 RepID=UPI003BF7F950
MTLARSIGGRIRLAGMAAGALAMVMAAPQAALARADAAARPNVIVIVTDDQGYRDVGFNGSPDIPTPNIDRIAREGVRFTRGYVAFPVCAPSRAGLLTGRYPARFGFDRNPNGDPTDPKGGVPRSELMLSEALKAAGYGTKAIGKWHMGTHPTLRPRVRGFDEFYGFIEGGHGYMPGQAKMEDISQSKVIYDWYYTKLIDNGVKVDFKKYLTEEFSDRAVEYVDRMATADKPFFLYLAYNAPHAPLQVTDKYLNRFPNVTNPKRRAYMAMISAVDDGVGQVLQELDKRGIAKDTVVFFLSDNGGVTNHDTGEQPVADNAPLRGGKSQLFEGGVRVPFAVRWPGRIAGGRDYTRPVSSLDIFGTLAGEMGLHTLPRQPLDGVNLVPYLAGTTRGDPHPALFWRKYDQHQGAMVVGDLKYLATPQGTAAYNLRSDVAETTDVSKQNAATMVKLDELYGAWAKQMAPRPAFPPLGTWPAKAAPKVAPAAGATPAPEGEGGQ